ncbi:NupC/NupG family nucleoside CNT transporter [Allosaccharopolyspora coralli]|uniref:NupC/NupG family nucleoside CNT transporter n=1 Tax=Allosaccharopolyspora coralli TaxID=2665642 RepID=UPI001C9E327D|nr:nucleoside transporter C-terminal domain-containing protein [Allosaccharopolyspora coralli]
MQVLWGIGGMVLLLALAFALSTNRRAIRPRTVIGALAIQVLFAFIVLRWDTGERALAVVSAGVQNVIDSSEEGIEFLVGPILPSEGTVVAFQVLPLIVFVASLTAVLYHWNILQWVVRIVGGGLQKVLGTSRAESMNATANIFLGQTEAPLVIRPYLKNMTRSELFAVMVGGLSTVAGSVLVGYATLGARLDYLLAAAFMAAPAALLMAKIIMPETEKAETALGTPLVNDPAAKTETSTQLGGDKQAAEGAPESEAESATTRTAVASSDDADNDTDAKDTEAEQGEPRKAHNVLDAAANGATDGLRLALNVGAMLFAFVSLIALVNLILGGVGGLVGLPELTIQQMLGYLFAPIMSAIGVPWNEAVAAGSFVGQKFAINEFVAFADFGPVAGDFTPKTATIITFALTGFANLSSLAILLGGLGGLAPNQRPRIAKFGVRAILAGTLANLLSATIAGMLIG